MKFMNLYLDVGSSTLGTVYSKAEVNIPEIGTIALRDCLSEETQRVIIDEILNVAKKRIEQGISNQEEEYL